MAKFTIPSAENVSSVRTDHLATPHLLVAFAAAAEGDRSIEAVRELSEVKYSPEELAQCEYIDLDIVTVVLEKGRTGTLP